MPVRSHHAVRPRPPAVPSTHIMVLRPSSVPQRVVLPSPPTSSLPHAPDPEFDLVRTTSPTVTRLLAMVVTDPFFESAAASAFFAELVDFAALCRLDYAASLVFYTSCPLSVRGDVLEDRQFELECLAAAAPHLMSTLLCPEEDPDAPDIPTLRTYTEAITVKRPPGSPPAFKARYVARGFSQPQRDYKLHSLDFSTAFLQGSLHKAIWLRRPRGFTRLHFSDAVLRSRAELQERHTCTDLGELRSYLGLQITRDRARCTITLMQSHMVQQVLQRFDFSWSSPQPTPLSTGHSLLAPPSDESVEPSGPYPEFVGCLICNAAIYTGAMATQELRWLAYLLTDLGERLRSPPALYVDNKAMIALCQDLRLEHRMKHSALRFFLT
ncbi:unnamed protein product [Closterium sp. NIES-53]